MTPKKDDTIQPAWVQLYMARRQPPPSARTRPRGRPRRLVPRVKKTAFRLTEGEHSELQDWQDRFSDLLGRHISYGETVGILARMCSARLDIVKQEETSNSLSELVEKMVGER
jgi:hypothetical protein